MSAMSAPALTDVTRRGLAALAALAVLALVGYAAAQSVLPPAVSSAPASGFGADRAFAHVQAIATVPHPVGSARQDQVRDYLVATLHGLGLTAETRDTVSVEGAALS